MTPTILTLAVFLFGVQAHQPVPGNMDVLSARCALEDIQVFSAPYVIVRFIPMYLQDDAKLLRLLYNGNCLDP